MGHDGKLKEQCLGPTRRDFLKAAGLSLAASLATESQLINQVSHGAGRDIILITNGQIIDGTGRAALQSGSLLIENGRFKEISKGSISVPPRALVIDATGKTVLPGFIDMHAHLASGGFDTVTEEYLTFKLADQQKALKQMLYWGITAAYDPVQPLEFGVQLRNQVRRDSFPSPRLFISGPGITAPEGWAGTLNPSARIELKDLEDVKRQIDRLVAAKVDILKLFYDDMSSSFVTSLPKLEKRLMEAVIDEAHTRKLKVMVHAYRTEDHKEVIRAGADIMAHSAITTPVDDEYLRLAKESKTMYVASLSVYHDVFNENVIRELIDYESVRRTVPKKTLDTLRSKEPLDSFEKTIKQDYIKRQLPTIDSNLKKVSENGVAIGVGPDTGVMGAFPGFALHREMELMVQAGLSPASVLVAATKTGAEYLGQPMLGTIEKGKTADMVIVEGSPLEGIKATRNVEIVIKDGQLVNREKLLEEIMGSG